MPPQNSTAKTYQRAFKVSKRQELDISSISACFSVTLDQGGTLVSHARFAYGGMAATPKRAYKAEQTLIGKAWSHENISRAMQALQEDFTPISDHRASAWYRAEVAQNLLRGFWLEVSQGAPERLPYRPSSTINLSDL